MGVSGRGAVKGDVGAVAFGTGRGSASASSGRNQLQARSPPRLRSHAHGGFENPSIRPAPRPALPSHLRSTPFLQSSARGAGEQNDVGMAQYRQSGADRIAGRVPHDLHFGGGGAAGGSDQISIRVPHKQGGRIRRPGHKSGYRRVSVVAVAVTIALGLLVSFSVFHYIFRHGDMQGRSDEEQEPGNETRHDDFFGFRPRTNRSVVSKQLRFGKGSVAVGRDSRYWDRDDRRRDDEYGEDSPDSSDNGGNATDDHLPEDEERRRRAEQLTSGNGRTGESDQEQSKTRGLYNEAGRTELKEYEEKYEESLQKSEQPGGEGSRGEEVDSSDEYDDGFGIEDAGMDDSNDLELGNGDHIEGVVRRDSGTGQTISSREQSKGTRKAKMKRSTHTVFAESGGNGKTEHGLSGVGLTKSSSSAKKKTGAKGNSKRHKFSGCEIKFLNSTDLLLEPLESKKFSRFSLHYSEAEDRPGGVENWEPRFAGHQALQEREESFYARDQKINCGFVKGPEGSSSTGFDLAEDDVKYMSSCHIVVSSCIFGNSDHLKTPGSKTVKRPSRKNVCFVMFVDEDTLRTLSAEGQKPDSMGFVGLWKIIVVKNLPYTDMRRVGKIPKFLTHRLFPSARYSIWLDSKLRLTSDPQLLLEYFLWRKGFEYAISNHYDRHCVWEEVMQNKKLNKFNHTIIDEQFMFYQADGLTRFDPSDPNTLLPSYVPEGSFILRAHTPMSNLFSCLWFNEVDRFTPRDQLSFAYTYLKLRRMNPEKPFHLNMFKDCERRAIAKLYRHRIQNSPLSTVG